MPPTLNHKLFQSHTLPDIHSSSHTLLQSYVHTCTLALLHSCHRCLPGHKNEHNIWVQTHPIINYCLVTQLLLKLLIPSRDPGPGRGGSAPWWPLPVCRLTHAPLQWSRVDNGSRGHAAAAAETFALKYFKTRSRDLLCRLGMIDREQVNVAHIFWSHFCVDI